MFRPVHFDTFIISCSGPRARFNQRFLSSVFEGFREERSIATQSILKNNNIPVGMEQFPNGPDQWKYITALIDECDIFIVIVGNRYGSLAKGKKGYVEIEYEYAKKRGLKPLAFYSSEALQEAARRNNPTELEALSKFINKIKKESGITSPYTSIPELGAQIFQAIDMEAKKLDSTNAGWIQVTGGVFTQLDKQRINQEVFSIVDPLLQTLSKNFFNANTLDKSAYKSVADSFYQVFCDKLGKDSDPIFIDLGYWLTDIYERTNDFVKSTNIANDIIRIIESQYQSEKVIKKEHIRKLIGCAYSMVIAKEDDYSRKIKLLGEAKPILMQASRFLENVRDDLGNNDYLEIKAILNSDLGALATNYYDNDRKANVVSDQDYLNESLTYHKVAQELRRKWLSNLSTAEPDKTNPIEIGIAQSTSNIAGIYYRLGDFERALRDQKNALNVFNRISEKTRAYAVKGYIIGIYIAIWKKDQASINLHDYEVCCNYGAELANVFYEKRELKKAKEIYEDKIHPLKGLTINALSLAEVYHKAFSSLPFALQWYLE